MVELGTGGSENSDREVESGQPHKGEKYIHTQVHMCTAHNAHVFVMHSHVGTH